MLRIARLSAYSYLRATIGSTRVARRAGNQQATREVPPNNNTASKYETGSTGPTPNSSPRIIRETPSARTTQSTTPVPVKNIPWHHHGYQVASICSQCHPHPVLMRAPSQCLIHQAENPHRSQQQRQRREHRQQHSLRPPV